MCGTDAGSFGVEQEFPYAFQNDTDHELGDVEIREQNAPPPRSTFPCPVNRVKLSSKHLNTELSSIVRYIRFHHV